MRCSVSGEHAREVEHVLGLEPEVELLDDLLGEQLDERGRVGERGDRDAADEQRRQPGERAEVGPARGAATRGRWTLTTTSSPVTRRAAWTCAIDAAAIGSVANSENTCVERAPELALHDRAHVGEPLGRHLVAQLLELVDELVGEQPLERRDDLAELHVGGPEPLERAPEPAREPGPRAGRAPLPHVPGERARAPTIGDDPAEAGDGREPAPGEQPGHLGPGAGADPVEPAMPDQRVDARRPTARGR